MKIVKKPWGKEEIWAYTEKYVGKNIFILQGKRLSLQHHEVKDETIRVIKGELLLLYGKDKDNLESTVLSPGESFHIGPKIIHRMSAISDCELVEVSKIELDDIIRHADDYGRV